MVHAGVCRGLPSLLVVVCPCSSMVPCMVLYGMSSFIWAGALPLPPLTALLNNISQKVRPANCQPRAGHNALDNTLGTWDPGSAPSHRIIILFKLFRTFLDKIISPGSYNSWREVKKNYDLGTPRWPDPSGLTKINSIVTVIWICLLTRPRWGYLSFNKVTSAHIPSRIFDVKMTDRPGLPASPRLVCRPPRSADFTDGVRRCRKISSRHLLAPQIHPEFFN